LKVKNNMKKILTPILIGAATLIALPAKAVCPVCIVAVGAGLGFSRYLGIDDTITGLWIGGLTVAIIMWTINWARPKIKKAKFIPLWNILIILAYYAMVAWPLATQNFIGHPLNVIWGVDKIILGIGVGSILFWIMSELYIYLKKENNGHAYFPFQKVVMPFGALAFFSFIFYLLTR
jgi:hypothetical protein